MGKVLLASVDQIEKRQVDRQTGTRTEAQQGLNTDRHMYRRTEGLNTDRLTD